MKYIILLGDGMPDRPTPALGNKTPLERARTPQMDFLATHGRFGLLQVIPKGLPPGSDVGHLSVLGYNPKKYYTGRAPIEAAAMGIQLGPRDVAFRCNFVSLKKKQGRLWMKDFSAGHIPSKDSHRLIRLLQKKMGGNGLEFYPGVGYRHLLVWRNGHDRTKLTPPHDISDRAIEPHLPKGPGASFVNELMVKSREILKGNRTQANSIWLWGQGRSTRLPRFSLKGGLISAVDIVCGVGVLAGLKIIRVPGATGFFDTKYENKAAYALRALKKNNFVFVHVESTDEAGHMGDHKKKIMALEDFDRRLIGPLIRGLQKDKRLQPFRILLTSDHATPWRLKTHTSDPVVFALYDSRLPRFGLSRAFDEKNARRTGDVVKVGHDLMKQFLSVL